MAPGLLAGCHTHPLELAAFFFKPFPLYLHPTHTPLSRTSSTNLFLATPDFIVNQQRIITSPIPAVFTQFQPSEVDDFWNVRFKRTFWFWRCGVCAGPEEGDPKNWVAKSSIWVCVLLFSPFYSPLTWKLHENYHIFCLSGSVFFCSVLWDVS